MKKKPSKPIAIFLSIVLILAILLATSGTVLAATIPNPNELIPPGGAPIDITILAPQSGEKFTGNKDVYLVVDILGLNPLDSYEVIANGEVIITGELRSSGNHASFTTSHAFSEGTILLSVRAKDAIGYMGISNPISISVIEPGEVVTYVETEYGETLEMIAERTNQDLSTLLAMNSEYTADQPFDSGKKISIPLDPHDIQTNQVQTLPWPSVDNGEDPSGMEDTANLSTKIATFIQTKILPPGDLPTAPNLRVIQTKNCGNIMEFVDTSDNELGFFVYRSRAGEGSYERIATLKANTGSDPVSIVDQDVFGLYSYYVAAFNGAGESPSLPISFSATDPRCINQQIMQPQWTNTSFQTLVALDSFFCYVSSMENQWLRLPQDPRDVYEVTQDAFNTSALPLPALDDVMDDPEKIYYAMECWGWSGDSLLSLGSDTAKFEIRENQLFMQVTGGSFTFEGSLGYLENSPAAQLAEINPLLSSPTNLHFLEDPTECKSHQEKYGSKACIQSVSNDLIAGKHVLAWELVGHFPSVGEAIPESELIHYHLYTYNPFRKAYESFKVLNEFPTMTTFTLSPDLFAGQPACFAVRAVHQLSDGKEVESDWSNHACLETDKAPIKLEKASLTPVEIYSIDYYRNNKEVGSDMFFDQAIVEGSVISKKWYNDTVAQIRFDLSPYKNVSIQSARLKFKPISIGYMTESISGMVWGGTPSCYDAISYKVDRSWVDIVNGKIYHHGTESFDVSSQIQSLLNVYEEEQFTIHLDPWNVRNMGIPNFKKEGYFCRGEYGSFVLEITYFPGYIPGGASQ